MDFSNPNYFTNRELSWLKFNERVLEEAQDKTNPVLERLKFLAITASNMDEFFMVRASGLMDQIVAEFSGRDPSGMTPKEQLKAISECAHSIVSRQYSCLNRSILPSLEKENVFFRDFSELTDGQIDFVAHYFEHTVFPVLTPMAIDQSRPFPLLITKSLNIIANLDVDGEENYAVVQVPTVIPRLLRLPSPDTTAEFIFLEEIVKTYISKLFPGHRVMSAATFRILRNSDLSIDEEDAEDLLHEIERSVKRRKWGEPVRLEVEKATPKPSREYLEHSLGLDNRDIYDISGPLDLTVWAALPLTGREHLKNPPLPPIEPVEFHERDMFEVIRERDVLVHHPYQSFKPVLDFINTAASDPRVLAIKQTLYRVSGNSPIVTALMRAAENGKQVTVLVELKARFDEENNINWAKRLEASGCHVIYGLVGLKTHCKICLVVRSEDDAIRRYIHLGTGNYNDSTAQIYTDLGFFTCKETFGHDISALFNVLTGYATDISFNKIHVAPSGLRAMFLSHIRQEAKNAKAGKDALIVAKMNSLVDSSIIQALYAASSAGVKIRLIVRGICCLKTGIKGVSENITVVSIVDRFLEHSRIFYFENAGSPRIFLSSADWMPRNLDRRVEVAFPIDDAGIKERVIEILDTCLSDTIKLRVLAPDGDYERLDRRGREHVRSQLRFYEAAVAEREALNRSIAASLPHNVLLPPDFAETRP